MAELLRRNAALVALALVCVAAAAWSEAFLTRENLFNVLRQNSMAGLLALGMLFAILSGGIDLSLGATLAAGGVAAALLSAHGSAAAVAGAVAVGALVGLGNGLAVVGGVQPFVATLVTNMALRGALLAVTHEGTVRVAQGAAGFRWLGRGEVGTLPVPALLLAAAYLTAAFVLARTRFGLHVYAVGDGDEAARLIGLNVAGVRLRVYALSGAIGGLAGALLAARVGVGQPTAGLGWELAAITAVVLGTAGGPAGAGSTLVGVLFIAVTFNALNLEGTVDAHWQWVLRGGLLLLVVVVRHAPAPAAR